MYYYNKHTTNAKAMLFIRVYFHFDTSLFEKWGHFLWVDGGKNVPCLTTKWKQNEIHCKPDAVLIESHILLNKIDDRKS